MKNDYPVIPCKVVLLGASGVGKTSIISRYIQNTFLDNFVPTMGGCFAAKVVAFPEYEKNIKFEIWDTAGQEKYRSINKIFYKDADIAILVYDITRRESFDEVKDYWFNQLVENAPKKINISIAANKSDLYEYEEVDELTGKQYSEGMKCLFHLTSAKNASGVDDLFYFAGVKFLDPNFGRNGTQEESLMNIKIKNNFRLNDENTKMKKKKRKCC